MKEVGKNRIGGGQIVGKTLNDEIERERGYFALAISNIFNVSNKEIGGKGLLSSSFAQPLLNNGYDCDISNPI